MEATIDDNFLHHNAYLSHNIAQAMLQLQHPSHPLNSVSDLHLELDLSMLISLLMATQSQTKSMLEAVAKLPKPRRDLAQQQQKCRDKIDEVRRRNLTLFGRVANFREQMTNKLHEGKQVNHKAEEQLRLIMRDSRDIAGRVRRKLRAVREHLAQGKAKEKLDEPYLQTEEAEQQLRTLRKATTEIQRSWCSLSCQIDAYKHVLSYIE